MTAKDVVEGGRKLRIPVAQQKLQLPALVLQFPGQVAGLLLHPSGGGMAGAARVMHAAATDLEEEQDVQPLQPSRLDGEEVGRQ